MNTGRISGVYLVIIIVGLLVPQLLLAGGQEPRPIHPEDLHWQDVPGVDGLQIAWVLGAAKASSLYQVRVKLARGARIPPHTHPDERHTTILSGRLLAGFGEQFDAARMIELKPGSVYVAPAGKPHYLWARDAEVIYLESGHGPTAIQMVKP